MTLYEGVTDCPAATLALASIVEMPPEFPDEEESTNLLPCSICGRTFAPNALQRHENVCEKLQSRKREIFDSTKQRKEGWDVRHSGLNFSDKRDEQKKKSRWREKHQEFLRTIRAARENRDDPGVGDGETSRHIPSDYVQCPHCERYFGPKASDRHINWCEEQKTRLPRSYTSEDTQAIQRLKTRTKYIPPKPGHNDWRAPKKRDVISSIPPSNVGANITPPGRLISPPPPSQRQVSPPPISRPNYSHRHMCQPPISPVRRGSSASLPPGRPRYSTSSLDRNTGKQFSSMLQSVTGCSPGYGNSSGYGSQFLYGTSLGSSHPSTFTRSASLRLPRRRPTGAGKMARHRDLASDMLASVTLGGKAKREEPEGDEDSSIYQHYDRSSPKIEHTPTYDPFSAAELQFQDLLGPSERDPECYNLPNFMGSTRSLKNLEHRKFSFGRDLSKVHPKPRATNLLRGPYLSLCSLGLDYLDLNPIQVRSHGEDDSSELESPDHSPRDARSPECGPTENLPSFSSSRYMQQPYLETPRDCFDSLQSGSKYDSRSRSVSSEKSKSVFGVDTPREHPEGSGTWSQYPSQQFNYQLEVDSKIPTKDRSPSPQTVNRCEGLKQISSDESPQRESSSFSTDSSYPHNLSYPSPISPSERPKTLFPAQSSFPSFCYECGNKYPMDVAKFCCHCGAKRLK